MFTGADWCGKFVGISKKNQIQANAQTTQAFIELGKNWFTPDSIPDTIFKPLEKFVHSLYGGNRWECFKKLKKGANLPLVAYFASTSPELIMQRNCSSLTQSENLSFLHQWDVDGRIAMASLLQL